MSAPGRAADRTVGLAVLTLPYLMRERYREQWLADLRDASEVGVSRLAILVGALTFSLTLARGFEAHGYTLTELAIRRLRWGCALVAASFVALIGFWWSGGLAIVGIVSGGVAVLAGIVVVLWLVATAGALLVGVLQLCLAARASNRAAQIGTFLAGGSVLCLVGILVLQVAPARELGGEWAGVAIAVLPLLVLAGVVIALLGWMNGLAGISLVPRPPDPITAPRARRLIALLGFIGLLLVIAIGTVEALVWSPLAMTDPEYGLAEIYGMLSPADRSAGIAMVVVWAAFWTLVTVVVLAVVAFTRARALTPNRIIVLCLALASVIMLFQGLAGFSLGMSISDTVPPMGGGRSWQGLLYSGFGTVAMIVAILRTLVPGPPHSLAREKAVREPSTA